MNRPALQLKPLLIWLAVAGLFGAAAFFSNTFAGRAAFIFCLILPILSWLLGLYVRRHIRGTLSLPLTSPKGETVSGLLTLYNDSFLPIKKALIPVTIGNDLTGGRSFSQISLSVPPRGSSVSDFKISSKHCGMVTLSASEVFLYDWFGFLPLKAACPISRSVTILPEIFASTVNLSLPYTEPGETDSWYQIKGSTDPTEIFALRNYQAGDPIKRIHWKLSAKRDDLIYKEISQPINQTLLLYWDKTPISDAADESVADALAESFASVALAIAGQGIPFTLGWFDREGYQFEDVTNEEDLIPLIPMMVRTGVGNVVVPPAGNDAARPAGNEQSRNQTDGGNGPQPRKAGHLTPDAEMRVRKFSKVLWFGSAYPFEAEPVLPSQSACLLCSENDLALGNLYVIRFAPEEAKEILSMFAV